MKLADLDPSFLKRDPDGGYRTVDSIIGADGIMFLCPVCFIRNKGAVGTHSMICWQPHVPDTVYPKPGRWKFHGTDYSNLTLDNSAEKKSSSVKIEGSFNSHFHITNGNVDLCNDCKP